MQEADPFPPLSFSYLNIMTYLFIFISYIGTHLDTTRGLVIDCLPQPNCSALAHNRS